MWIFFKRSGEECNESFASANENSPAFFAEMTRYCKEGDLDNARRRNFETYDLHKWLYIEGNPVGIKSAMQILGFCENHVRLPLHTMSDSNYAQLKSCLLDIKAKTK